MNRYMVTTSIQYDATVEVDAANEDAAIEMAERKSVGEVPGCASVAANFVAVELVKEDL